MNEEERIVLKRCMKREIPIHELALHLFKKGIIPKKVYRKRCTSKCSENWIYSQVLDGLMRSVSLDTFLKYLSSNGYGHVVKSTKNQLSSGTDTDNAELYQTPQAPVFLCGNLNRLDTFAQKVKDRIHDAKAVSFQRQFKLWSNTLLKALSSEDRFSLREQRQIADCCFVLLDTCVVLQRTHSESKTYIYDTDEFRYMNNLISKTSNPSLSSIRYRSRYGVALAQSGQTEKGLEYLNLALDDAMTFLCGKDIGNCMYAIVNVKLSIYDKVKDENTKREILDLIEKGIQYFSNEDEETIQIWRRIYYDKKAYCHLAINSDGNNISDVQITEDDLRTASHCFTEMRTLFNGMDARRKMHFYRAQAKYHSENNENEIAKGFLKQALTIANHSKFNHDVMVLNELAHSVPKFTHSDLFCSSKEPIEHEERIEPNESKDTQENVSFPKYSSLPEKCQDDIAKMLKIKS